MPKEESRPWPRFLAPTREVLAGIHPPEGPFDPLGKWEHHYTVCLLEPERLEKGEHARPIGSMLLKRNGVDGGHLSLDVDMTVYTRGRSGMRTQASMSCAADRLATPIRWELRSDTLESTGPSAPLSISEKGSFRDGVLERSGRPSRKIGVRRPVTSNWSLVEAVQRLPFDAQTPLEFDMFEDLDLYKPAQSLRPVAALTLELGGRPVRLHGFRQIGRGILPMHYWLDDSHRLIAATGGLRGIIWDGKRSRA